MADTFDARQAEPNQTFVYHDFDGARIVAKADDKGVIRPDSDAQVRLADAFGLPTVAAAKAEHKAAKTAEGS